MRVSQLLNVMEINEEIVINDFNKKIDEMKIYNGVVKGVKKDDPVNKMHVVAIAVVNSVLYILASESKVKL